ncbi:IclR family transcriptional regulator [Cytobacillus pseudoceanisediminis]|uniref:IclR family transcriptional regulator n=1 Tax=Cytobacillus pseudoceanisediminis TaxID=3051614 RepID=UPI003C2CB77C
MKLNKSASRVMDILTILSIAKEPLSVSQLSRELNAPKSSTFEILTTMVVKGFLEFDDIAKTYKPGIKLFEVGTSYFNNTDLTKEARPYLEGLVKKTGETVFLATASDGDVVYLDKVESPSSIRTTATLGMRNPMYLTGLGKAFLAAYSDQKVAEIMSERSFIPVTSNTIKDYDSLMANLKQIRQRGYSIDNEENEKDVFCIAAPIWDYTNQPIAAISIAGLASRMTEKGTKEYAVYLIDAALNLSKRLGYQYDQLFRDN